MVFCSGKKSFLIITVIQLPFYQPIKNIIPSRFNACMELSGYIESLGKPERRGFYTLNLKC